MVRSLHRTAGLLLFVLLPLMVASFGLVIHAGIQKTVNQHPFYQLFGEALLTVDVLLFILVPIQVFFALKLRSNVYLHSALIFSTVMGLMPPVMSRLFSAYVPGLIITGPETIHLFEYALLLGMLVSFLLSLALFKLYPRFGWPWLLAAVMACVQYLLYATLGQTVLWHHWVTSLASISAVWFFGFGLAIGILACLWGWHFGQRPVHAQPASLAGLQRN